MKVSNRIFRALTGWVESHDMKEKIDGLMLQNDDEVVGKVTTQVNSKKYTKDGWTAITKITLAAYAHTKELSFKQKFVLVVHLLMHERDKGGSKQWQAW